MSIYNETSLPGLHTGRAGSPKAAYIQYSLPKSLGKQVVLCTREGTYQGQLSKLDQDTIVLRDFAQERQIEIRSIYAVFAQD
jgi:hypothetical protein